MKIIKHLWRDEGVIYSRFDNDEFYRIDKIFREGLFYYWHEYRRIFYERS